MQRSLVSSTEPQRWRQHYNSTNQLLDFYKRAEHQTWMSRQKEASSPHPMWIMAPFFGAYLDVFTITASADCDVPQGTLDNEESANLIWLTHHLTISESSQIEPSFTQRLTHFVDRE
ncbi:hypothetical protein AMTRI_Chr02g264300 [Amborella trichopoda]